MARARDPGLWQAWRERLRRFRGSSETVVDVCRRKRVSVAAFYELLYWDRDGLALWAKRLEVGTFELPARAVDASQFELDATDLSLLLNGIDLGSARRRKRYRAVG